MAPQRQWSGHSDDSALTYGSSAASSPGLNPSDSTLSLASLGTPISPPLESAVADSFVFAFDIDGVLVRGGRAIPEAIEAMKVLNGENEFGITM
jgi:hypothetical protein